MIMKKWLALGMALLMVLSASACGSIKEKAAAIKKLSAGEAVLSSVAKMKKADSLKADIELNMELSMLGQNIDMDTAVNMAYQREPKLIHNEIEVDMDFMGDREYEIYAAEEDSTNYIYTKDALEWKKSEAQTEELAQFSIIEGLGFYLNSVETLTKMESEERDGSKLERYVGVLRGDAVYDIMKHLNIFDRIQEASKNSFTIEDSMFENLDDIPVVLWIDHKTGYLVQADMDMTNAAKKLYSNVAEQMEGIAGSVAKEIGMEKLKLSIKCTDFNEVPEIVLPKEVQNAKMAE